MSTFLGETVIHSTKRYQLTRDEAGNYTLRRYMGSGAMDGRSIYFEGGEARLWADNLAAIGKIDAENGWSFDFLCDSYADLFDFAV